MYTARRRSLKSLPLLALLVLALAVVPSAPANAGDGPTAKISYACSLSARDKRGGLGATYVTTLRVSGVSCSGGKSVVKGFNSCRKANGKRGKCHRRVRGLSCSESRSTISTQFNGSVTCKARGKQVFFRYTQFT